jgi:hypothetical protein
MEDKAYLKLHPSEAVITNAAAQIFSGYVAAGQVSDETEQDLVERSVDIAIRMTALIDARVQCEDELM